MGSEDSTARMADVTSSSESLLSHTAMRRIHPPKDSWPILLSLQPTAILVRLLVADAMVSPVVAATVVSSSPFMLYTEMSRVPPCTRPTASTSVLSLKDARGLLEFRTCMQI